MSTSTSTSTRISWTADKNQRLLAALVAAHPDLKINYKSIATLFGSGATYDSIEARFRPIKRQAKQLSMEISTGVRPSMPPPATPRKRKRSAPSSVTRDRVAGVRTPTRKTKVKISVEREEEDEEEDEEETERDIGNNGNGEEEEGEGEVCMWSAVGKGGDCFVFE